MKKTVLKLFMTFFAAAFIFSGCTNPAASNGNDNDDSEYKTKLLQKKTDLYNLLVGTKWIKDCIEGNCPESMIFADDSITFDNIQYSVNLKSNIFLPEEVPANIKVFSSDIYFYINSTYYGYEDFIDDDYTNLRFYLSGEEVARGYKRDTSYSGGSSGNGGNSSNEASVAGTYSYTNASGSETNGSVTLSNGTWSYSGSKVNMAATSGTYTISNSKITFKWTAKGYDVEDTFTITDNGNGTATWVCDNAYNSVFLNMLFGMAAKTEITLGKSN